MRTAAAIFVPRPYSILAPDSLTTLPISPPPYQAGEGQAFGLSLGSDEAISQTRKVDYDSGRRTKEATGGYKQRAGSSGGKHPKNKLFVGGVPPKKKRHPSAKV
jgi:hypothetical protein